MDHLKELRIDLFFYFVLTAHMPWEVLSILTAFFFLRLWFPEVLVMWEKEIQLEIEKDDDFEIKKE